MVKKSKDDEEGRRTTRVFQDISRHGADEEKGFKEQGQITLWPLRKEGTDWRFRRGGILRVAVDEEYGIWNWDMDIEKRRWTCDRRRKQEKKREKEREGFRGIVRDQSRS